MKSMKTIYALAIITIIIFSNCSKNQNNTLDNSNRSRNITIADTIIYDMLLVPTDTTNSWENECLKGLNHKALIDYIFAQLYSKRFTAYDFYSNNKLSTKDIENIERKDGSIREKITKIQFSESWSIDSTGTLTKKINSMTLGIEVYSDQHTFLGHGGLFKVICCAN